MDDSIASAVVLPDEPSPPPPAKRRQSSVSEESSKRPRLGDGAKPKPAAAPSRGERGRERRLFGSVFGALSQNQSTTAGQKRRAEIEKRQLAQRKQEDEESEQRKVERTARRKEQRWKEQRRFERESMQLRHDNLLHTARFLKTKTEPHLYYKPWQTSEVEDELVERQITEAHETIKRELEELNNQEQRANGDQRIPQDVDRRRNEQGPIIGQAQEAEDQHSSAQNGHTNGDHQNSKDQEIEDGGASVSHNDANDHPDSAMDNAAVSNDTTTDDHSKNNNDALAEEVIEEATEDTVIY